VVRSGGGVDPIAEAELVEDSDGILFGKWDARDRTTYLLRPDNHVAARWRRFDPVDVISARDYILAGGQLASEGEATE
ncbi:MAG: hypothetical protein AAF942_15920, partial [Pseudomonadota bacterium]